MELEGVDRQAVRRVEALVDSGRVPHAMVLDGGTQNARLRLAEAVAQALVCTAPAGKPCGNCGPCRKAAAGIHPDIVHVVPEVGHKTLSVDVIRRMRDDAYILPNESDSKVYIIDQADLMQDYAQNALLKILEEPPQYATFLLCTPSKAALLGTVLSRTAVFSLDSGDGDEASSEFTEDAREAALNLARALCTGKERKLLSAAAKFEKKYDLLPEALEELRLILRDALVAQNGQSSSMSGQPEAAAALADRFSTDRLMNLERAAGGIAGAVNRHANKNLTLTRLCSNLAAAAWD